MEKYVISKILNHNVVQCYEITQKEDCMIMGNGIGFQAKVGEPINNERIEKIYFIKDSKNLSKYQTLIQNCDEHLVSITEKIIEEVGKKFGYFNESLHITLLDHLNFSIYRIKHQLAINNIFLDELSMMYKEEFAFSKRMLDYLNSQLDVCLPESEVGFITLHIHSAIKNEKTGMVSLYLQIVSESIQFIEKRLKLNLKADSIERSRLTTHLKFAIKRVSEHITIENAMHDSIKTLYPNTYTLALALADHISTQFDIKLPEGEIGYLTLHIQNIVNAESKERESKC